MTELAKVVHGSAGRVVDLPGEHLVGLLTGLDTGGFVALTEYEVAARHGTTR